MDSSDRKDFNGPVVSEQLVYSDMDIPKQMCVASQSLKGPKEQER